MARVLFTVWPYPTHLHPFLAVALAMRARGHEVAFYSGGAAVAVLAAEGFQCFPFRAVDWSLVAHTVDDLIAGRRRPSQMRRLWPRFLVDTVLAQVRDLKAVLAAFPADVLVCDIAMWAPILILRERDGVLVAALSHVANCILPGPDGPVQGIALPRRRGWWTVWRWLAPAAAFPVTARTRRKANALRRQFGLAAIGAGVNECTGRLPLYIVPSAPEFDNERRDLPDGVRYVGPCLWEKPADTPPATWLAEIPLGQPVVVVDEGALYTHEPRVLDLAARALAGLPVTVVLLAGAGRDVRSLKLGTLAGNILLRPHTALSDVLPLAAALVTNGNSESVMAALAAEVPAAVLPSIWDQAEMAWRVEETGTGLRLSPRRTTASGMRRAVLRLLEDPAYRARAAAMGAALAARGGPARAAELVEELIARGRGPQTESCA